MGASKHGPEEPLCLICGANMLPISEDEPELECVNDDCPGAAMLDDPADDAD